MPQVNGRFVPDMKSPRTADNEEPAAERACDFRPVDKGFTKEMALAEAERCMDCKKPLCVEGCPVNINIPKVIEKIREEDFGKFDMIVVMDDRNYEHVHRLAPSRADAARIFRMREFFSRHPGWDHVPDPYYEGAEGFELVLDMLEDGCEGILAHLGK